MAGGKISGQQTEDKMNIPEPYNKITQKIKLLEKHDRYLGAYIFGSVVRDETTKDSDFDVQVIVDKENLCKNINHPFIHNKKLDITFRSLEQIETDNDKTLEKGDRIPMLAESIIIFDKNGNLSKLKQKYLKSKPKKATKKDFQFIKFMLYHSDSKAKRNLNKDKHSSLLAMNININEILKFHYQINGHWWVSNKRLLNDLRIWDKKLAKLLEIFIDTNNVNKKYKIWTKILDHVAKPIGGWRKIEENNCNCKICKKDLNTLLSLS